MIKIRKAEIEDVSKLETIAEEARLFLKGKGLPQWQNGQAPNKAVFEDDIKRGVGVTAIIDGEVVGYGAVNYGPYKTYENVNIWQNKNEKYAILNRVMLSDQARGNGNGQLLLKLLIENAAEKGYSDIRIDTHPGNDTMQNVIVKVGFQFCGDIMLDIENGERIAYQKLLN